MIGILKGEVERYCSIMQDFLATTGENADLLQQAYQFGIDAVAANLSVGDMAAIHKQALSNVLRHYTDVSVIGQIAIKATDFLAQCLLPIEESRQRRSTPKTTCDGSSKERFPILLGREIGNCQQTEAEQKGSEERFRSIFEQVAVGISYADLNGQFLKVNQKYCDILGYSTAEILTMKFQDITYPDDLVADEAYVCQLLAGEISSFSMEKRYLRKDGSIIWVNITVSLIHIPSDRAKYLLCVTKDISDRKQVETALQRLNAELETRVEERTSKLAQVNRRLAEEISQRQVAQDRLNQQIERLYWMYNLASNLNEANSLDEIYHVALQGIQHVIRTERVAILIFDDRGVPRYQASTGISEAYIQAVENYCASLEEIPQTKLVIIPDAALQPGVELLDTMREAEDIKAAASFPMEYQGCQLGKIVMYYDTPHQFTDEEIRLIQSISTYTSVAITRKEAETALRESQRFVQSIADSMPDILYVYDMSERRNIYINQACLRVLGYAPEELQAMSSNLFSHLMHPDDLTILSENGQRLHNMETGEVLEVEYRMKHANGEWRWLHSRDTVFLKDADGKTKQIVGIAQDISDRKTNEQKLRQQLAAMEASADGIAIVNHNGIFTYSNHAHAKIFGYSSPEETVNKSWKDFYGREVVDYVESAVVPIVLTTGNWQGELVGNKYDGSYFPVEVSITALADGNWVCIYRDISDRKRAETEQRETYQRFQSILDNCPAAIYVFDREDKHILVNRHVENAACQKNAELFGKSIFDVWPDDFATKISVTNKQVFESGMHIELEETVPQPDGLHTYVTIKFPIFNEQGFPYAVCGISTDITERKRAEVELEETQQFLQSILDNFPGAINVFDREDKHILVNRHVEDVISRTNAELRGKSLHEILPSDFAARVSAENKQVFESGLPLELEGVVPQSDGLHTYVTTKFPLFNEQGFPYAVCGISTDITDRKRAEAELYATQQRLQSILDNFPGAIYVFDKENRHILANRYYEQKADQTNAELFGKRNSEVWPSSLAQRAAATNQQVILSGIPIEEEEEVPHEDGLHTYFTVKFPLYDEHSLPYAACGISLDITDRKQAEIQVQESLKEKEILLQEIHHRVKNNLQVVASLLNLQKRSIADPAIAQLFEDSRNRVYSMAMIHEKLYQSKQLNQVNLGEYLQDLVDALAQSSDIQFKQIRFQVDADAIDVNIETAMPCGLIVNELVTNAIKHAFPDRHHGQILIECRGAPNGLILLTVCDNGVGIPAHVDFNKVSSLGLRITNNLVRQLKGTIEIDTSHGTCFSLKFAELGYQNRI